MMNWLWIIPWVVTIIFFAGWYFGGKVSLKKERNRVMKEEAELGQERNFHRAVANVYEQIEALGKNLQDQIDNLNDKLDRHYYQQCQKSAATINEEENSNG